MSTLIPKTAEAAHAVARQHYRAMLHHAAAGNEHQTADSAGKFHNAAMLAQMYELRNIRIALMRLVAADRRPRAGWVGDGDDAHDLHAAAPDVPYDGRTILTPVPGGRMR